MSELNREAERLINSEPILSKNVRIRNILDKSGSFGLSVLPFDLDVNEGVWDENKSQFEETPGKDLNKP